MASGFSLPMLAVGVPVSLPLLSRGNQLLQIVDIRQKAAIE